MPNTTATVFPLRPNLKDPLPSLCGWEEELSQSLESVHSGEQRHDNPQLDQVTAGFACALHMHQPTIPAGSGGALISNLQHMFEHPNEGDNHNAGVFAWCYGRMGEFIPELVERGCHPRIMLDYSGNLLWGLQQMGREDILDQLRRIACDPRYFPCVEWLGTMWSHAVIPSTPVPDIRLHIQAWRHYFASVFGLEALSRVQGFSPPEMHLPNHPDTLYEYIKALKECGYRWLLVQEHSVEQLDGSPLRQDDKYTPNRLVARNSQGESLSITALIKTQGSDTKLVAQMQPYHEARSRGRQLIGDVSVPCLVTQIADGENGGVMMNEFPRDFQPVWSDIRDNGRTSTGVVGFNGSEYLDLIEAAGVNPNDYPCCQPVQQHKIWAQVKPEEASPEAVEGAIAQLRATDPHFHMEGASWTNDLSWVQGYENVLEPMNDLSARFHAKYDAQVAESPELTKTAEYRRALLYVLLLETSCFRYWGQGTWTDYARTLYEQGKAALA
jgi:hypothetical protein